MHGGPAVALGEFTVILQKLNAGDLAAWHELMPIAYQHLRTVAGAYVRRESVFIQPTEIVHDVYLRLLRQRDIQWVNRGHFFGVAAHLIRLILVDKARATARRERRNIQIVCDQIPASGQTESIDLQVLDSALERLAELDQRQAQIVEMRFFAGMTIDETAAILGISSRTVKREWHAARAWLYVAVRRGKW